MRRVHFRCGAVVGQLVFVVVLAPSPSRSAQAPALPAVELVRRAVNGEAQAQDFPRSFLFRDRKQTPRGSQTRLMAETADAIAAMTIAYDDKPLTAEQRQGEMNRLRRVAGDPDGLRRKHRQELEDAERVGKIVKALPDAFLYEYAGTEQGKTGMGVAGRSLTRLTFKPNPRYSPPSRVELVLTGMQGFVLLDPDANRIAKIDGTLARDVGFGWGILGHLDRGGRFIVEQGDIGHNCWEITRMDLSFTGKILLFKNINIQSTETFSDFQPLPQDLRFSQAVDMLAKEEATFADNHNGGEQHK